MDETYLEYLKAHREVRAHHSVYYEKLALLDGGTIALTATVVLSSSHNQLRHKYLLAVGVGSLAIALISLLIRNLAEDRREELMTTQQYALLAKKNDLAASYQLRIDHFGRRTSVLERVGVFLTICGLTLLTAVLVLSIV